MTAVETPQATLTNQQLSQFFQYTIEAYKVFEKFAENLPNPMTAGMFKQFAVDERNNREIIELKIARAGGSRLRATLGADVIFNEILEGELSYRESAEFLISRERTLQRKCARSSPAPRPPITTSWSTSRPSSARTSSSSSASSSSSNSIPTGGSAKTPSGASCTAPLLHEHLAHIRSRRAAR